MNDSTTVILPLTPQASPVPPWLTSITGLLYGLSAITRSSPIQLVALVWSAYWLVELAIHKPAGEYMSVYLTGSTLFSIAARTWSANLLMKKSDFERRGKKSDEKERERGWVQTGLDAVEVGFGGARGVGWNYQIRNLPLGPAPNTPRRPFVIKKLQRAIYLLLIADIAHVYIKTKTPFGDPSVRTLRHQPLPLALINAWVVYVKAAWTMDAMHNLLAAFCVSLHIFPPSAFPPLFGSFAYAYTVRGFWAHTWHQMMRLVALPYTNALVSFLNLKRESKSTYWVKVVSAFFWAWALHVYGTLIAGGDVWADFWRYAPQPLGFWIEEVVVGMARKRGITGGAWAKALGYLWVAVFQGLTLLKWTEPAAQAGAFAKSTLGFSLVETLLKRYG